MFLTRTLITFTLCAALVLSACNVPTPAASTPTPENTQEATPTPAYTATAVPTTISTIASAAPGSTNAAASPVISLANAVDLVPLPLTLPEYPQRLLWVSPGIPLPTGLSPIPDLLAYTGSMVYPITLNSPAVGQPVQMAVPGQVLDFAPGLASVAAVPDPNTGPVILYDMTGKPLVTIPNTAAYGASYSSDGSMLAITSPNELAVNLFNTSDGKQITHLTGFQTAAPVYSAGIVPGNQTIYWISRATFEFQDVQSGQMGQKLNFQDFIGGHGFSPDGSRLALSVEGKLILYSVPDAQKLAEVTLSHPANSIAFSPDGTLIASDYGTGIQIWDAATLAPVTSLPGPNSFTGTVTFSPDGRYLVSQHENNVIEVWWVK